jgi:hypothetical protein
VRFHRDEPPLPVHVILPSDWLSLRKVRAFVDFAIPRIRNYFARRAMGASDLATTYLSKGKYPSPTRGTLVLGSAARPAELQIAPAA